MTQVAIQKMKETEILVLTRAQTFWHYFIVPFLLIFPIMATIDVFQYYVTHTYSATRPIKDIILTGYIWILPAIVFYFIQKQRLHFKPINMSVSKEIFRITVNQTAKQLKWSLKKEASDVIVATSGFSWRSWGEHITIIWSKDKILFNSICDPDNRPSVASYGMNKVNRKTFEKLLKANTDSMH